MSTKLTTNFNTSPYFDDFSEDNKFVKILFRPSNAVQTRELNQLATILQNQVERFGDHVFKDGSIVDGIKITYYPKQKYVHVGNKFNTNTLAAITSVNSQCLLVSNTGVRAAVKIVEKGFEASYPDTNRFYVDYIKTGKDGSNNDVSVFQSAEELTIYNENQDKLGSLDANNVYDTINVFTANATANSTGTAYAVSISDGIVYQKGFFSKVDPQTILVKEFDTNTTNYAVGFKSEEEIITEDIDESLNDNALGAPNYNAPGAYRLKINPVLISVDTTTLANDSTFLPIATFDEDHVVEEKIDSAYNKLGDEFRKRTYEESGNYVVKPFTLETFSHPSNTALMKYQVSPGIGYVKGARVEFIGSKKVDVERATDTAVSEEQIITTSYGNYVVVDELVGSFDFDNLETVDIYDTAQNTLTDTESSDSAPSGSKIGEAYIRSVKYVSGIKGNPSAKYHIYLFGISMNSGYSFSSDAKSFYMNGTFGKAKADIVLEGSKAVIKESDKNSLVFELGTEAAKRLTNNVGTNDTQFIFRDTTSATLQANGFVTFTLNTPYAGGSEKLAHSVGSLSETLEPLYSVTFSESAYTANLSGTISASGTTVTGTATSFDTELYEGAWIRAQNGDVRRITDIANATSLTVSASLTVSSNTYGQYFTDGQVMNLSGSNGSIEIVSNTQFSVSTGLTLDSGTQTVYAQYPVLRTSAVPLKKEVKKDRFVKIDCTSDQLGPWNLGLVDVYSVSAIYVGTTYSDSNPDRKSWFSIDSGQTNSHYNHSKLVVKPKYKDKITSSTKILVKLNHLVANNSAGVGFFSVESYPFIQDGDTANSTNIHIAEVPQYNGIDVRNLIDFRPQKYNTANSSTTIGGATENPSAANSSYIVSSAGSFIPSVDTNFQCDVEYYMPRIDLVSITDTGEIDIKKGSPSINPRTPFSENDSMVISKVYVHPYPSLTTREGETYSRPDISSSVSILSNKRYTMKDVGTLDSRIKRLEYYVVLNTLEKSAKDLLIPDESGLDRFKNGIFANPFNSHRLSAVNDFEYKIAIDPDNKVARPLIDRHPVDYTYVSGSSSNVTVTNKLITLPYTATSFISQPYASKYRVCTESVWDWSGDVSLYPEFDHFRDEQSLPAVNVDIDLASPWEQFADTPFASNFGDWRVLSSESEVLDRSTSTRSRTRSNGNRRVTTTTRTTTETTTVSEREVESIRVDVDNQEYDFGSFVKDVKMSPYMRAREVAFVATGLKPNTKMYFFFDDENVSEYCAPGELSGVSSVEEGQEHRIVTRTADFGEDILSDDNGNVIGMFRIPASSFRTGERLFQITDVSDLDTGFDAALTSAKAVYTASSLALTTQNITLTTATPTITPVTTTEQIVDVSTRTTTSSRTRTRVARRDPIAQSFLIDVDPSVTGTYIPKIGVYFKKKDQNVGVTCYLVEMDDGHPNSSKVIASKHLDSDDVNVSNDASSETVFEFDRMGYLTNGKFYAFMIKPDGDSPEYQIWLSELGGSDISTNEQIFSNPYVGVTFISANMNTWTPIQDEDIKFNIYRAKFTSLSGYASFENEDDEYLTIDGISKVNSEIAVEVGDLVYTTDANGDLLSANSDPVGRVQLIDEGSDRIILDSSTGGGFTSNTGIEIHREFFTGESSINSNTKIAEANIVSVDDMEYSILVPRFSYIQPSKTSLKYEFKGYDTSNNPDSSFTEVLVDDDNEFYDKARHIMSKSNELIYTSGNKTGEFKITLTSENDYVSPVIDLTRKSALHIENLINNSATDENTRYGEALSKYVSPVIELASGQDAEDHLVYLSGYRPYGSDIKVYGKFLNGEDPAPFEDKEWTELEKTSAADVYSQTINTEDFIEYVYSIPNTASSNTAAFVNSNNSNIMEYDDADGARYIGYKYFALKIVLLSDNKVNVPRVNSIRSIALQV